MLAKDVNIEFYYTEYLLLCLVQYKDLSIKRRSRMRNITVDLKDLKALKENRTKYVHLLYFQSLVSVGYHF